MGSFNKLKAEPEASYHYCIQGPFRFISRSGEYGYTKSPCEDDFNAAYYNAIMWNITKIGGTLIKQWKLSGIMQQH